MTRKPAAFLIFALTAGLLGASPCARAAPAQDVNIGALLDIESRAASGDQAGALAALDAVLQSETDPRIRPGLALRKAGLLVSLGKNAEAGKFLLAEAENLAKAGGRTAPELRSLLRAAAEASRKSGDVRSEAAALAWLLQIADAAGQPGDDVVARLGELSASEVKGTAEAALVAHDQAMAAAEENSRALDIGGEGSATRVKIYYATDRARTGSTEAAEFYGGYRNTELEMGSAEVTIPAAHKPGQLEKPSIWSFEISADPEHHVILQSVTPGTPESVFAAMRADQGQSGSDEAFVFVHGYNVTFENAARRTAQMAFDMNFTGLPILYSWPSAGSVMSYISDTAAVNLSGRRLTHFLDDVAAKSGAKRIHLVAHSMGNRALTDALELFALRHAGEKPAFDQVLFTAPDLDAGLFAEMAKTIRPVANRMTLYASDKDWALAVSRKLHGDAPRAGQGGEGVLRAAEFDTVDMTQIGDDMLAHSYFANNPSALSDILALFWRNMPPEGRCGMVQPEDRAGIWRYAPDKCDSSALLSVLTMVRSSHAETEKAAEALVTATSAETPEEMQRLGAAVRSLFPEP